MLKYFAGSYLVTIAGLVGAYFWGEHVHPGSGFACVFITFALSILEVSLSFENAVVNAMKLEKMTDKWRHRFLTWGILIAVFGMRLVFPILVVSVFAGLSMLNVAQIAVTDTEKYTHYLHLTHAPIVTFGGIFLLMLFLRYFINNKKSIHWIEPLEKRLSKLDDFHGLSMTLVLIILMITANCQKIGESHAVLIAGISGVIVYLLIDGITGYLESVQEKKLAAVGDCVKCAGFMSFLYLELIDASFSLDGVLGAFALSKDIIIISIGLAIGAMFVRSLTIMLVEKQALSKFLYLEHGAHWAIGTLSVLMLLSTVKEIPEMFTGLIGLLFIIMSLISSILHNKKKVENA